jgi:hypothetical protein
MWREMHAAIEIRGEHSRAVKSAAERGEREIMVLCFSSEYCPDRGRAINNFGPDLPKSLTGFAKCAYDFLEEGTPAARLQGARPDHRFPGGMPGEVGMFLGW